ncbi:MAG: hypothetical protein ACK4UJ_06825 [Leptonema sp. (in: bacteria)]
MKFLKIINFLLLFFINYYIYSIDFKELTIENYSHILPEVEKGNIFKILEKTSENHGYITVIGIINEKPDKVWVILQDPNKKMYKDILENHILYKKENYYIKKKLIDFPFPFDDRWTIIEENIYDHLYSKQWKEKGGDIKINRGAIRLFPYKGKTLMIFKASFDPGLPFVPEWIIQWGLRIKAPMIINQVRNRISSG